MLQKLANSEFANSIPLAFGSRLIAVPDDDLFELLDRLNINYIIRVKGSTKVSSQQLATAR